MRYLFYTLCIVYLLWIAALEWMLYPFYYGEHQVIMLSVGFIFAFTGVFVILLLVDSIRRIK